MRELILLAAGEVAALGDGDVALGPLVVRAWQISPARFGLPGFEARHPNSSRVQAKLSGPEGLVGLGWMELAGPNTWRLTKPGHRALLDVEKRVARAAAAAESRVDVFPKGRAVA